MPIDPIDAYLKMPPVGDRHKKQAQLSLLIFQETTQHQIVSCL